MRISSGELAADLNYIGGAVWFDTATGFFDMDRIPLGLADIGWKNVLGTMDGWWVANDFFFFLEKRGWGELEFRWIMGLVWSDLIWVSSMGILMGCGFGKNWIMGSWEC